jgi:hypothetical protein
MAVSFLRRKCLLCCRWKSCSQAECRVPLRKSSLCCQREFCSQVTCRVPLRQYCLCPWPALPSPGWLEDEGSQRFLSFWLVTGTSVLVGSCLVNEKVFAELVSIQYGYGALER